MEQHNILNPVKSNLENIKGFIFNIQRYSIHDGPGIRTTVFLKGCPLCCVWCQNPESQRLQFEIFFDSEKCNGCGKCVEICPEKCLGISGGKSSMNRNLCKGCGRCIPACPNQARSLMGQEVNAGYVFKEIMADEIFYHRSGGGVTLSGGEPLAQPEFASSILQLSKGAGLHTAVDTSGYAKWEVLSQVLRYADLVLFDFKHMDPLEHLKCTGVSNDLILENAKKIYHELSIPIMARIPLVPGYNDSEENIIATAKFVATELDKSIRVHLLPYHRFGEAKYDRLGINHKFLNLTTPSSEHIARLIKIIESYGLNAQSGG